MVLRLWYSCYVIILALFSKPSQMPVDFFESCVQTNDIEYGGNDLLEIYHKNLIKQRLATTGQYVACTRVRIAVHTVQSVLYCVHCCTIQ